MPTSLILVCLWAITANVLAMRPSRDNHWRLAYLLIALGIPLLGFVTWQTGPWIGLACLIGAMSILRWPLIHLLRRLRGQGREGKIGLNRPSFTGDHHLK